ncbi:phage tail protein, partial [Pseudomonas aeruginosa]|uniref:phage tail protein n=1 Tax=Pseudomonas aeruginosa TaxID=287 RepID=UPI003CE6B5E2
MCVKVLKRAVVTAPLWWRTTPISITALSSQSASQVARETKVRRKLVKERARLKRATVKNPQARIRVNRGDLPVIKLG